MKLSSGFFLALRGKARPSEGKGENDMKTTQLEFNYENEKCALPQLISERIATDGADFVSTNDLATLVFGKKAADAMTALQTLASGRSDIRSLPTQDVQTMAAIELLRRVMAGKTCSGPEEIFNLVRHFAYDNPYQESVVVVTLDGSHAVIRPILVGIGTLNRAIVHPRECFCHAVQDHAAAVVLCHSHPSGCVEPSGDDLELTHRMKQAGLILGIDLLDHVVFSKTDYYSLGENGQIY